MVKVFV